MVTTGDSFGPFVFDRASARLRREGADVPIGGRGAAVLGALLAEAPEIVSKTRLMDVVWPQQVVEEANLAVQIAQLRRALGTRRDGQEWIATVARVGYRLLTGEDLLTPGKATLAVLPFTSFDNDPAAQRLADGMVDDIITAFSRFGQLAVVARQSSSAWRDRPGDIRQVARELGVRYLLEGSFRQQGPKFRVSVQLIDGISGVHLWAENLDGDFDNLFDFHDRIAARVAGTVEPHIRRAELDRIRRRPPASPDAYDLYLQSLVLLDEGKPGHINPRLALLDKAIAIDPKFADALAYAAGLHEKRWSHPKSGVQDADDAAKAIELSERAVAAEPENGFAVVTAGIARMIIAGESDSGFAMVRRGMALNPNSMLIVNIAAYAHACRGDFEGAIACNLRALQLAPDAPDQFWSMTGLARNHLAAGRPDEALVWGFRCLAFNQDMTFTHCLLAACHALLGQPAEATESLARARALRPGLTVGNVLDAGKIRSVDIALARGLRLAGLPEGEAKPQASAPG